MSKTSSSRLTASRKKRRRATRPGVEWLDAAALCCWRLDMLAALLQVCGHPLEPAVLECIGHCVGEDARAMQSLLDELGKEAR